MRIVFSPVNLRKFVYVSLILTVNYADGYIYNYLIYGSFPFFYLRFKSYAYKYFFLFAAQKTAATAVARISAASIEAQTPERPKNTGRINTAEIWNTSVLRKETAAEISPLPKAVNIEDTNIANPENIKDRENIWNAFTVISKSSAS